MFAFGAYIVAGAVGLLGNGTYITEATASSSTVTGTVTYTQGAQTLVSAGTSAGSSSTTPAQFVFGTYVTSGVTGQSPFGYVVSNFGISGNICAVTYTQGAQTLVSEGTTGDVGVAGAVAYTQGAQTLVSAGTVSTTGGGVVSYTQGAQTLVSAGTVKRLVLVADGTVGVTGVCAYTQDAQTLVSTGGSGGDGIGGVGYTQGAQTVVSAGTVAITAVLSITQGADTLISGLADIGDRRLVLTLVNRAGTTPVSGTYRYAFFEQRTADTLIAPTHRGAVIVSAGACTITLPGSNLDAGDVGFLVMSDSDGTVDVQHRQLSAPVTVS